MSDYKYIPHKQRMIQDISPKDSRITIIGKVKNIDLENMQITITDGSEIVSDYTVEEVTISGDGEISVGDYVRLFGLLQVFDDGTYNFRSKIIQKLADFNFELYKKIYNIKKQRS